MARRALFLPQNYGGWLATPCFCHKNVIDALPYDVFASKMCVMGLHTVFLVVFTKTPYPEIRYQQGSIKKETVTTRREPIKYKAWLQHPDGGLSVTQ
ncbi:MAG: hypothetical protein ACK5JD_07240 [Mangrovibacterium sp.]